MGICRFLYNNLISSESMITVSSLRNGLVTDALKDGTGSASMTPSGDFSGTEDLEYTVEIDSIAGGAEVGQATFKWSDGGGGWDATGVATGTSPITLNNGVKVAFASGSGADFVVGDKWYFKAINKFNGGKMIEWDRDTRYRSSALESPNTITIDLGSAQEIKVLVIFDHNFTSGVTLALKGNDADAWGAPAVSEAISYNANKIVHYLSSAQTYRYWQLQITDAANTDLYVEIGELFLGSYFEPTVNYSYGTGVRDIDALISSQVAKYGTKKNTFFNFQKGFNYDFKLVSSADIANFEAMFEALGNRTTGIVTPLYFNEDSGTPNDTWMAELLRIPRAEPLNDYFTTKLAMKEIMRSV